MKRKLVGICPKEATQMRSVAIVGASGVVGARALQHLLAHDEVAQVVALGRRELPVRHGKLVSKIADLQSATATAAELPEGVVVAVCCLGTTMKQAGSKEAFRAVDRDAVIAFAEAALRHGAQRFLVVSSVGANARSRSFYLRTKGEAEEALARLGYAQLTVLRPSFIDDQGERREHRPGERIGLPIARAIFSVLGKTRRHAPITADLIARALARLAFDETTARVRIIESDQLQAIGRA
jgi:uncharacterized protein YbjT (DUF2867 family)